MSGIEVVVLANGKKKGPKKMAMTEAQKKAAARKRKATNEAKKKAEEAAKRKRARARAKGTSVTTTTRRTVKKNPAGMTKAQMKELLVGGAVGSLLTAALDYYGADEEMMATPKDRAIAFGALAAGATVIGLANKKAARLAFPAAIAPAGAAVVNLVSYLAEGKAGDEKKDDTTHAARATAAQVSMPAMSTAARVSLPQQVDLSGVIGTASRTSMPHYWPSAAE